MHVPEHTTVSRKLGTLSAACHKLGITDVGSVKLHQAELRATTQLFPLYRELLSGCLLPRIAQSTMTAASCVLEGL